MTTLTTLECPFPLRPRVRGRHTKDRVPQPPHGPTAADRVPRIARLMALALRFEELIRAGKIRNHAELARLGHVSRARISQIMNLRLLAPDVQEQILFLPPTPRGRDPIHLRLLQPIASLMDWQMQRRRWLDLLQRMPAECPSQKSGEKTARST
jgi:hypothetical protein